MDRRTFLGGSLGGFLGYALRNGGGGLATGAKRVVVLWMDGGPSQIDTFDPKPGEDTGGEFRAIETAAPGLKISETLPAVAKRMNRLSIVRGLASPEGDHARGQYLMHTGFPLSEGFARPAAGATASAHLPESKMPKYVTIGAPGFGPAYLGAAHAPFTIDDPRRALETLRAVGRKRDRLRLMRELDRGFGESTASPLLERREETVRRIEGLVDTPFMRALEVEPGGNEFATRCRLALNLLKAGVGYVEVQLGGWDTHIDNFANVRRLCGQLDAPWAALVDDLVRCGLWDETVLLWMGEFGRTPTINPRNGRDHYPRATCAVLGGGGIAGGRVYGETDKKGIGVVKERATVADLFATLFERLGLDPKKRFRTEFGGTATATDGGIPIKALLA
jgi:hypothetical protein